MPIRFATDNFGSAQEFVEEPLDGTVDPDAPDTPAATFMKTALLKSKVALNCANVSAVSGFSISGDEPSGSSRRLIFQIDGSLWRFKNGNLIAHTGSGDFDDVIKNGNKVSVLTALNNISAFVGKKIYPIIALQAPSDAAAFPTIKVGLDTVSINEQLSDTVDSPIYELGDDTQTIISIEPNIVTEGSGSVAIQVRLRNSGSWSSYMSLASAANQSADAVQFRMAYAVVNVGTDSAQVESITVTHTGGRAIVAGDVCNFCSVIADYDVGLKTAYCIIRHAPLVDAELEPCVNFSAPPKHKDLVQIGTASGSAQSFTLPDSNVVASSIQIFLDGEPFYNFDFDTGASTVTLTAAQGKVVAASYDYDYGTENWQLMTAEDTQPYNDDLGSYSTRFSFVNEDDDATIANVRVRLKRLSGSATENLGKATGKTQLFVLKHKPKPSSISFTNNVNFSYDEDTGILSLVAAKNTALSVSYNWLGDSPTVYSFAAGFSVS